MTVSFAALKRNGRKLPVMMLHAAVPIIVGDVGLMTAAMWYHLISDVPFLVAVNERCDFSR